MEPPEAISYIDCMNKNNPDDWESRNRKMLAGLSLSGLKALKDGVVDANAHEKVMHKDFDDFEELIDNELAKRDF